MVNEACIIVRMRGCARFIIAVVIVGGLVAGYTLMRRGSNNLSRDTRLLQFLAAPDEFANWVMPDRTYCGSGPFLFPTSGYIGYLWGDSFRPGHSHQGIDIFAGTEPGKTPVYAAYDGYLTRLPDWKSTVIVRIPDDPLQAGRQIWNYYTHMAATDGTSYIAPDFPSGTDEVFIQAGTLLGYQGNYSGDANTPTGVHLHFSIVRSDSEGLYQNELEISNTIDPSPYFNLNLNGRENSGEIILCATGEESTP